MTQVIVLIKNIYVTELGPQIAYDVIVPPSTKFSGDYIVDVDLDSTQNDMAMWTKIASDAGDYGAKLDTGNVMLLGTITAKDVTSIPQLVKPVVDTKPSLVARFMDKMTSMWG